MARKLPWNTSATAGNNTSRPRPTPRPKARRAKSPSNDQQHPRVKTADDSSTTTSTPRKRRRVSRTPSTSPPPGPPAVEFMQEGYKADDIYMMVEDELYTVAQSFTRHLHHAEYMRLKKKARDEPVRNALTMHPGLRPETKKKLEANALRGRQTAALQSMTDSRAENDTDTDGADDPWHGTSLAGLMGNSPPKMKTALVGLEPIPSSTRAARGFGRGSRDSAERVQRKMLDDFGTSKGEVQSGTNRMQNGVDKVPDGDDAAESSSRRAAASQIATERPTVDLSILHLETSIPRQPRPARRTVIDFDDGFDADAIAAPAPDQEPSPHMARHAEDRKVQKAKNRKRQLNEVPTFLF